MLPKQKPLVLVVEDHPDTQYAVVDALEQDGYETVVASDGETALRIVRERRPRLVYLDLNLPHISGYDVCEIIREDPSLRDVPILMTSAGYMPEVRGHALEAGADIYLPKPFDLDRLVAAANGLAATPKPPEPVVRPDEEPLELGRAAFT